MNNTSYEELRQKYPAARNLIHIDRPMDQARRYLAESLHKPSTAYTQPSYYKVTIKGVEIDVVDIINAFNLSFMLGNALKYLIRCGRKSGEPKSKDLSKSIECITREMQS